MVTPVRYKLRKENIDMSMPLVDRLLIARDISPESLEGNYDNMHDAYMINDMEIAVSRIIRAIKDKEKVICYGDYDCDGITSTLTIIKGLKKAGLNCDYYIPHRLNDGYGMNMNSVYDILDEDYSLVITVDCGITSFSEIETLQENGVDVIVTDHHECKDTLPKAFAVLDNKRSDNEYPFPELCGAGMAFKLIQALYEELGLTGQEKKLLMYTALGTVADVMPLIDENRIIVNEGLTLIKATEDYAIKNLLRVAGKSDTSKPLTAQDIAFYIAPLINAASRTGEVDCAMNLFLAKTEAEAIENADKLHKFNNKRKDIEKKISEEAFNQIVESYNFMSLAPIVVYGDNWHKGVIGIVASRIVDKFHRPAIILTKEDGEDTYHGSCRSYGSIDMMQMLKYAEAHIVQYGGHTGAAGLTVKVSEKDALINKLKEYAKLNFSPEMFIPETLVDIEVKPEEITLENLDHIKALEPFGHLNEEPLFICKNLKTKVLKKIGTKAGSENAHLRMTFSPKDDNMMILNGIGFYKGDYVDFIPPERTVDVIFRMVDNEWNGRRSIQMLIENVEYIPIYKDGLTMDEDDLYLSDAITIPEIMEEYSVTQEELLPNKQEYIVVFREINKILEEPRNSTIITNLTYLASIISTRTGYEFNPFKLSRILEVLDESNNITFRHMLFDIVLITKPIGGKDRIRLTQTSKFKKNHNLI